MTKVGKSDGEGTFPGRRGNDKVAPIAAIPAIVKTGARTRKGNSVQGQLVSR